MSNTERDQMRAKLDDLSQQLDARIREFKERGELSDSHQSLVSQVQRRHEQMRQKLASVEATGTAWDVFKVEFERDFSSIHDDLLQLDAKLDADEMKREQK